MDYIFRGRLCAYICDDCVEELSGVVVRLYRNRPGQDVPSLAAASPKNTQAQLTSAQADEKASFLLAETETDEQGNFTFHLGEKQGYQGEAFEVDVYLKTIPHRKSTKPVEPAQVTITTLQPQWRETPVGLVYAWDYCISSRFWCWLLSVFDVWVICGRVTICQSKSPVAAVTVFAFDADWIQDDPIGSATTGADGRFRIYYSSADFTRTPFSPLINLEQTGGPDLFFRIESASSQVLLSEPRSRGRDPDRENAGNCFCVELCVDITEQPPYNNPYFTHVGDFHRISHIDPLTGLTAMAVLGHGGPDYGFFGALKLRGFCPKTDPAAPAQPMHYRFLFEHPDNPGVEVPITGPMLAGVSVGSRLIQWDLFGTGLVWTFQNIIVAGSGATPDPTPTPVLPPGTPWGPVPDHVIVPDVNGWINVDQNALDNGFYGPLLRFICAHAVPGGAAPGDGAGNAVSDPKNGVAIKIIYEARQVGGGGFLYRETLDKIKINHWEEVRQLNLQQFIGPPSGSCTGLTTDLNILYTADHELMASWSVSITTAAVVPGGIPALPAGSVPRGGFGNQFVNISTWPSCSYIVWLTTRRMLTDGENDDDGDSALVSFCK